jgi:hypothetical protein
VQGRVRQNVNFPNWGVSANSTILITAAEWTDEVPELPPDAQPGGFPEFFSGRTRLGRANVYVTNIGPHDPEGGDGGVEFYIHADSDYPIIVMVTITVLEDVETVTYR